MYCKNCGEEMKELQDYCLKCGLKTGDGDNYCQNCGTQVAPEADVCIKCGVKLKAEKVVEDKSKVGGIDKVVLILIALFFGSIGIHNFMLGESKKGVFKIIMCFCFGISSIFALIDVIKLATDSYVIDKNALI